MSQDAILKKLAEFIEVTQSGNESSEILGFLLGDGCCTGFSMCFGSMLLSGNLDWWEAALHSILAWKNNKYELDQLIQLPGAQNNARIPLREIFRRVVNYIISHQKNTNKYIKNFYTTSDNKNTDMGADLEILTKHGLVKPKTYHEIAGYFPSSDLKDLINPAAIENSVCLISNTKHTIFCTYQPGMWLIYDPNYDHAGRHIYKCFRNQSEFVTEVIRILGNSLAFKTAHYTEQPEAFLALSDDYVKNNLMTLIQENGLLKIAEVAPSILTQITNRLFSQNLAKNELDKFIQALIKKEDLNKRTTLHYIARNNPSSFEKILNYLKSINCYPPGLMEAIKTVDISEWNVFHTTIIRSPQSLNFLIDYLAGAPNGNQILTQLITSKMNESTSAFQLILNQCSQLVDKTLDILTQSGNDM